MFQNIPCSNLDLSRRGRRKPLEDPLRGLPWKWKGRTKEPVSVTCLLDGFGMVFVPKRFSEETHPRLQAFHFDQCYLGMSGRIR